MKLSPKINEVTSLRAPETRAELVAFLETLELKLPDAGRAARFLRREKPGRPVLSDRYRAIEAYQLEKRGMSRWSACMRVAKSIAGFNTESKPESIARRLSNKLAEMLADPADRKIMDETVLSIKRSK